MAVSGICARVSADPDYYDAFARSAAAEKEGDYTSAARALIDALHKYPGDFALMLRLGWIQFCLQRYAEAERYYNEASRISDGAQDAAVGLGWTLIQQERCDEGVRIMHEVLAQDPDDKGARNAIRACEERARVHAVIWVGLGGALYVDDPWKKLSGDVSLGTNVGYRWLRLGGAYHFLRLEAEDQRVPGFSQHEAYLQAGWEHAALTLLAHGALVWSGDVLGGSRHVGVSGHLRLLGDISLELTTSFYDDLSVSRVAPAWALQFGSWSITPGVAVQFFAHETLASASLASSYEWGTLTIWISGKYGTEYRAAYLSHFSVFNSTDRSGWSASAGLRWRASDSLSVYGSYSLLGIETSDHVSSQVHVLSLGSAVSL